ncbi:beta-1,3-galactosyltransferase 5-like [Mixophyes fleayi]|uniref:beta-1,3-galactosyltransferase 5-like n=1 Tax=Mixophyes fleayi TaxID=3061075 RepID=UPI003F4D9365
MMRLRFVSWFYTLLLVFILFCIANIIIKHPVKRHTPQAVAPHPVRESVNLNDGVYDFHLNISQFLLEFPHLQLYQCSPLLTPPRELKNGITLPLLLLAIKSHPFSISRRWALRQTWAKAEVIGGYMVKPVFLMGQSDDNRHMNIVKLESKEYGDILQWDFEEGHHNLSLKERCFLEWLHDHLSQVAFIFKGDDDVFVNPAALVQFVEEHRSSPHVLHGAVQHHSIVLRHSKYRISTSLFPNPKYPFFLSGGGFVFPGPSVKLLYQATRKIPVFPLDDIYFGFLVLSANLTLQHSSRFYVFGLQFEECTFKRALVVHRISPDYLLKIWSAVKEAVCKDTV